MILFIISYFACTRDRTQAGSTYKSFCMPQNKEEVSPQLLVMLKNYAHKVKLKQSLY